MGRAPVRRPGAHPGRRAGAAGLHATGTTGELADLLDLVGGDSARSRRFLGGVVAGALLGAAIAGSALLRRHRPTG